MAFWGLITISRGNYSVPQESVAIRLGERTVLLCGPTTLCTVSWRYCFKTSYYLPRQSRPLGYSSLQMVFSLVGLVSKFSFPKGCHLRMILFKDGFLNFVTSENICTSMYGMTIFCFRVALPKDDQVST